MGIKLTVFTFFSGGSSPSLTMSTLLAHTMSGLFTNRGLMFSNKEICQGKSQTERSAEKCNVCKRVEIALKIPVQSYNTNTNINTVQ